MRAGELRQRIRILRPTETLNEADLVERGWELVDEVWASVEPGTGEDRWAGSIEKAVRGRLVQVKMRMRGDVDEQCRIVFRQQTLEVVAIPKLEDRPRELVLLCIPVSPEDDD